MRQVFEAITITNPVLRCIQVEWNGKVYKYDSLCIEDPSSVVVGGKRLVPIEAKLVVT